MYVQSDYMITITAFAFYK